MGNETDEVVRYMVEEVGTQMALSRSVMVQAERDAPTRVHILNVVIKGLSNPYGEIRHPADWWQAFKERWYPRWAKKLWPVEWDVVRYGRFCPHVGVPDTSVHLGYLEADDRIHTREERA